MSNLTEISIGTRKFFVWLVIVFIAYLILKLLIGIGISYWQNTHPPLIPPPQMQFGKLPIPKFVSKISSSGIKFSLENIAGQPVLDKPQEATLAGKVYQMPKKLPTLLSEERAKKFAFKLGFTETPIVTDATRYDFTDPQDKLRTLSIDIVNMNFHLRYDWTQNPDVLSEGKFISKEQATDEIKNFLQINNLFDESILQGKTTIDLLTADSPKKNFIPATSLSNAQAFRLNFFRPDLDKMKILPPLFNQSYIYVIYIPAKKANQQMLDVAWTFWPIAFDSFATYPLKSVTSAWADLSDGYASVINMGYNNTPEKIVIRHIYLAYYDSEKPQTYLQPIYVFEGDNNFVAYLPAVTNDWLQ